MKAVDIGQENGAGGGKKGELDQNNYRVNYTNQSFYFLDIIILYRFLQNFQINTSSSRLVYIFISFPKQPIVLKIFLSNNVL
jgi:hypothetical protein